MTPTKTANKNTREFRLTIDDLLTNKRWNKSALILITMQVTVACNSKAQLMIRKGDVVICLIALFFLDFKIILQLACQVSAI